MFARLPGPVLVGFSELFDRAYGDPKTPQPYVKVTPCKAGDVILPFACPSCGAPVDVSKIKRYSDEKRGFSWCATCNQRFVLDANNAIPVKVFPSLVERDGETTQLATKPLNLLGAASC